MRVSCGRLSDAIFSRPPLHHLVRTMYMQTQILVQTRPGREPVKGGVRNARKLPHAMLAARSVVAATPPHRPSLHRSGRIPPIPPQVSPPVRDTRPTVRTSHAQQTNAIVCFKLPVLTVNNSTHLTTIHRIDPDQTVKR